MMGNEALQELSRRYVRGEISRPEYRLQRQTLIDEVTGFQQTDANNHSHQDSNPVSHSAHPANAAQTNGPSNILLKAGVISAAVVVVLILMYATI